jgi:DNA-binding response OmpR family regulator
MRILVIDDHAGFGETLGSVLSDAGCEVDVVHTPFAGNTLSDSRSYDLVLVDHQMPQMTGLELLPLLARRAHGCIVMVTGSAHEIDREKVRELGGDGLLPKPLDLDRLLNLLAHLRQREAGERNPLPEGLVEMRVLSVAL